MCRQVCISPVLAVRCPAVGRAFHQRGPHELLQVIVVSLIERNVIFSVPGHPQEKGEATTTSPGPK